VKRHSVAYCTTVLALQASSAETQQPATHGQDLSGPFAQPEVAYSPRSIFRLGDVDVAVGSCALAVGLDVKVQACIPRKPLTALRDMNARHRRSFAKVNSKHTLTH
jgi:hypothetical protein